MHISSGWLFVLAAFFTSGVPAVDSGSIRLASTTSAKSSGLLDVLVPAFEQESGYRITLTIAASGRALRLGRFGRVDVVLVHAPAAERLFVEKGWGVKRRSFMQNDFVLVGPAGDPAGIRGMRNAGAALKKIARSRSMFLSRGDDSGTHKKELECWAVAGIVPSGDWYYETGASMWDTLKQASEKQVYTLLDRGTWLASRGGSSLELLVWGDPAMVNVYSTVVINPARHANVNYKGGVAFSDWLLSPEGQRLIADLKIGGEQLFFPVNESDR